MSRHHHPLRPVGRSATGHVSGAPAVVGKAFGGWRPNLPKAKARLGLGVTRPRRGHSNAARSGCMRPCGPGDPSSPSPPLRHPPCRSDVEALTGHDHLHRPIASTSTLPYSPSIKASTSVKMSDGSTFPFTFRPTSFSRYALAGGPGMVTPGFGPTQISMHPSPGFGPMSTASPGSLGTMMALDGGFSLSPTAGFHPASYKGPGSFGAAHLSNMESAFCKNFVCCGIELDDLHGLLEHFEERHCQGGDIIGVEGFEGVALSDVAEGVGVSKALGIGPGMGNVPPPGTAMGVGNGTFEGEEDWSSDGTQSGPPSPYATQTGSAAPSTTGGKPHSNLSAALQRNSSPSSTPSPPGQPAGKTTAAHAIPQRYRDALSTLSTPASSVPGSPHPNADFDEEMDSMDIDLGVGPSATAAPPPPPSAASTVGGAAGVNDPLAALMQSFSVGGPFNVGGLSNGAASVMGGVGVPPSLLTGEPIDDNGDGLDPQALSRQSSRSGSTASTSHQPPTGASAAAGSSAAGGPAGKKRPNHDPVTGLTPTGRQPRPWVPPSEKPFKCTVPGCDKAYKQQNGLKYHRTHGHCNQVSRSPV